MPSTEHIERRLHSLEELGAIVRTMKALSAASIRQYEKAVIALEEYERTVELGLMAVLHEAPMTPRPHRQRGMLGAIVFGSDHGLCGRFNDEIALHTRDYLSPLRSGEAPRLIAIGARVAARLEQHGLTPEHVLHLPGSAEGISDTVQRVLLLLDSWLREQEDMEVHLLYNHHLRGARYRPGGAPFLPVHPERFHSLATAIWPGPSLPYHSLPREQLIPALLRQYLFVGLHRACAESMASEHDTRLRAMQAAEKSIADRLEEGMTEFRRARQDAITEELLDVVSRFEVAAEGSQPLPP
ncbi:MAG TPA: F0F1 ATP synthase subunit gamma [Chromatiales bacterium]|nr:F0F1 ATP synthase subunit gamma [Chromatiales bacterium]